MLTDVGHGSDQIFLAVPTFKNLGQDLRWKPVDGDLRIPDRPYHLQNIAEILLDAEYL